MHVHRLLHVHTRLHSRVHVHMPWHATGRDAGVPQDTAWLPLSPPPEVRESCDRDASLRASGGVRCSAEVSLQQPTQPANVLAPDNAARQSRAWIAAAAARGFKMEDSWGRHSGDGSGWSADASASGSKGMVGGADLAARQVRVRVHMHVHACLPMTWSAANFAHDLPNEGTRGCAGDPLL